MKKYPLVCVCIPHYNNEKTISETLDSLINQTYKNITIKIFDNCSTDNSMQILQEYQKKYANIMIIQNDVNIGGEANFTKCIQAGEGKYTAIFHADDVYLPTMIENQVSFLENHQDCVAVAVNAHIIDQNSEVVGKRIFPKVLYNTPLLSFIDLIKLTLKYGNFITCPSVMGRTDIYKNSIRFWNGEKYKTSADLDVWFRFAQVGKLGILSSPLMYYRESSVSYSYTVVRKRIHRHDFFLVMKDYLSRQEIRSLLEKDDFNNYKFLIFKDYLRRILNLIIQNKRVNLPLPLCSLAVLKVSIKSKKNFVVYVVGGVLYLAIKLQVTAIIQRIIKILGFRI